MEHFKSSPPLPGTYHSFYFSMRCYAANQVPVCSYEILYDLGCADEEAAEEKSDREHNPTPSADTQTGHLKGTRSVVRKRYSSQTSSDK